MKCFMEAYDDNEDGKIDIREVKITQSFTFQITVFNVEGRNEDFNVRLTGHIIVFLELITFFLNRKCFSSPLIKIERKSYLKIIIINFSIGLIKLFFLIGDVISF